MVSNSIYLEWKNNKGLVASGAYFSVLTIMVSGANGPVERPETGYWNRTLGNCRAQKKLFHGKVQIHHGRNGLQGYTMPSLWHIPLLRSFPPYIKSVWIQAKQPLKYFLVTMSEKKNGLICFKIALEKTSDLTLVTVSSEDARETLGPWPVHSPSPHTAKYTHWCIW